MSEAPRTPAAPRRTRRRPLLVATVTAGAALLVAGGGAAGWSAYQTTQRLQSAGDRFLDALRARDVSGAYALLSPARRATMKPDALAALGAQPAFAFEHEIQRSRTHATWFRTTSACARGALHPPEGKDWVFQLYLVRGAADDWTVESFALQAPASLQLSDLLPECGYGGPSAQYAGPPILSGTPPI